MKRGFFRAQGVLLLFIYLLGLSCGFGDENRLNTDDVFECMSVCGLSGFNSEAKEKDGVKISSRVYELFFGKPNNDNAKSTQKYLIPGGTVFGVLIDEEGATVLATAFSSPLTVGDRIISVNGKKVRSAEDVEEETRNSHGKSLELSVVRKGENITLSVTPRLKDGEYKLGVNLRSKTAGIGTITYIDPTTRAFGGLGHGVTDNESGSLVSIEKGEVHNVVLGGCKRGESGRAGELTGVLKQNCYGSIFLNTGVGVFGILDEIPTDLDAPLPVASRTEIKEGEAEIISTVKNGKRMRYKIKIEDVDYTSTSSKSFKIKVTDPVLVALTGGIVRGMSGSPIIQNGKLVGAVTHVMVADPTEGYGIFIENMLNAANIPMAKAS